jgi:hypothetical protein
MRNELGSYLTFNRWTLKSQWLGNRETSKIFSLALKEGCFSGDGSTLRPQSKLRKPASSFARFAIIVQRQCSSRVIFELPKISSNALSKLQREVMWIGLSP